MYKVLGMKKKILISCYGLGIGGIEKCLVNMLNQLDMSKYEIDVLLMNEELDLKEQIHQKVSFLPMFKYVYNAQESRKSIIEGGVVRYFLFRLLNKYGFSPWKTFKRINNKYDIAIAYSQNDFSAYYVIDKICAEKKFLWYHNGAYEKRGKLYNRDKKYYAKFDNIIAVSQACKDTLEYKFPNLKDKIVVLPNFIDDVQIMQMSNEDIEADLFPSDKISLLTVGRMTYEKGPDIAVQVCACLVRNGFDIIWYWIGDGGERSDIEIKIKELGIEKNFYLLGNKKNPYKYMKHCDIYVQPSRYEAYCTTTNEARILSKTIVATKVGGMDEQIKDHETGYLVDINVNAIFKTVKELILHPEKRMRVGANLRNMTLDFGNYRKKYNDLFDGFIR